MSLARYQRDVVVAAEAETAVELARRMREHRVGCVVVTRDRRPLGMVTDRDLTLRVIAEGRAPASVTAREVMTASPVTVPRNAGIETAVALMRKSGIRRLPIVDEEGMLAGMVTADDLTVLLARELADLGESIGDNVDGPESR